MVSKRVVAITAALVALLAGPSYASLLGPITQPRTQSLSRFVVDLPRLPYGPNDPLLGWTIRSQCGTTFSRIPPYAVFLMRRSRLAASWRPRFDASVSLRVGGRLYDPSLARVTRQYGGGSITFAYSGWTTTERQQLSAYVNAVYPVITSIYGAPASTITVTIIKDSALQNILGGVYVPALNEIHLPPIQDLSRDTYVLATLIVRAFHDDIAIAYDAWETGFARAVALVAHLQVDSNFDLSGEPFYLLPVYELLNQRPLAAKSMFPASGFTGMAVWRVGMAQGAWLKVYAENPAFFLDFNDAYYAEYEGSTPPLSQNVVRLRQLASLAAPQVEGMAFLDWFRRQFVLDTRGAPGDKLYLVALPQLDNATVFLEADHYRTATNGNEQTLSTTGVLQYILWDGDVFTPEAGTNIQIVNGQGFLAPTFVAIGGAQRVTVELAAGAQVVESWFPYGVAAAGGAFNEYLGVVVDADGGTVSVMPPGIPTPTANVIRGVFSVNQTQPLDFLAPTSVEYQPVSGLPNLRQANTGFQYYVFVLRAYPLALGTISRTFAAGLSMAGIPQSPDESDAADVIGLPYDQTMLSRWSPTLAGGYRYVFYPDTPAIEPGRGYWLKLAVPLAVTTHGLLPTGEFRTHLQQGWHQISNPFRTAVALSGITVKVGDAAPVTMAQAQASGVVGSVFRYVSGNYAKVTSLPPYEGVWIYVFPAEGCWLIIREP